MVALEYRGMKKREELLIGRVLIRRVLRCEGKVENERGLRVAAGIFTFAIREIIKSFLIAFACSINIFKTEFADGHSSSVKR